MEGTSRLRSGVRTRHPWTAEKAAELYRVHAWGDAFFHVNAEGHAAVTPLGRGGPAIDIAELVAHINARGVAMPCLIRFQDVLQGRVKRLNEAFRQAVSESGYENEYRGVFPIKVNQLHEVVEEVLEAGAPYRLGLECGSKPELIATLAHITSDDSLLICNGVKDAPMLRLILAAQSLGKQVIPVVEKYVEFEQIMRIAAEVGRRPLFGVRVRLGTSGSGRWSESGGDRSKFGLSIPELVSVVERLEEAQIQDAFALLHFHLGSQISDIQVLKQAVKEASQVYAQVAKRGVPVRYLDVGGGLGVNYDAGYGGEDAGINYSLQEYANGVVWTVQETCDNQGVAHPTLVSESGRAITAHHSVLIVPVLNASTKDKIPADFELSDSDHASVHKLHTIWSTYRNAPESGSCRLGELLEAYHDAEEVRREAAMLFGMGYLSLAQKALVERLFWSASEALLDRLVELEVMPVPQAFRDLEEQLIDHYLCDFSVFQSMLDHWAIGQGFPIMPIDRLDERPTRRAVLVDLTCDSDGKVSHYVSSASDKRFLPLHEPEDGRPYYLGFFLMGAYQDIMGDSHNLFGRVSEVHVYADDEEPGNYYIEKVIPAMSIQQMLASVQYFSNDLHRRMNQIIRQKVEAGVIRPKAGTELLEQYMAAFEASTYYDTRST